MPTIELVVLADDNGRPIGTTPKATVHSLNTPLHFAFSCFLLDSTGRVLMTRRALTKKTWPGVWTNSFCGHPSPGESNEDAIVRRGEFELGIPRSSLEDITPVIPDFRYRAVDTNGIVENEICPAYVATLSSSSGLNPDRSEVDTYSWIDPPSLMNAVKSAPFAFSPWLVEELADVRLQRALMGHYPNPR